jgi:hypothetical protein
MLVLIIYLFLIKVPEDFFNEKNSKCIRRKNSLGCYCMETNANCTRILRFLTLNGRFSVKANVDIIYREAVLLLGYQSAETFEDLVNQILYPIFLDRFLQKNLELEKTQNVSSLPNEKDCWTNGPDFDTAFKIFDARLNNLFRTFYVLNRDLATTVGSSSLKAERHFGTLLSNLNFALDTKANGNKGTNVEYSTLQADLKSLFEMIIPEENLSITDFLGLMGYSERLGAHGDPSNSKVGDAKTCNTSPVSKSFNALHLSSAFENNLPQIRGFDSIEMHKNTSCNLRALLHCQGRYIH